MKPLTVGSLFAGIGGFDLAAEWMGWRTIWFSEIDPYASAVLSARFPGIPNLGDITRIAWDSVAVPDVLCGGFPCQDISSAGKRAGIRGARSGLWSEYARAIHELRPRYVVVENVRALLVRGVDVVLGELADLGYDAEWQVLSANDVGAPHLRERLWIVAYPNHNRRGNGADESLGIVRRDGAANARVARETMADAASERRREARRDRERPAIRPASGSEVLARTAGAGLSNGELLAGVCRGPECAVAREVAGMDGAMADSIGERGRSGNHEGQDAKNADAPGERSGPGIGSEWWTVEPDVGRVAHGVSATLDIDPVMRYILAHGTERQVEVAQAASANRQGRKMRILRLYLEVAATSHGLAATSIRCDPLPTVPHESGHPPREVGRWAKEEAAVRGVPSLVSPEGFSCASNVRSAEMPLDPRQVQRWLTVGNRVDRLRGLGNAIVPQCAVEGPFRRITELEAV